MAWLNPGVLSELVSITGFSLYRNDRRDRTGGGVCMYIKTNLKAKHVASSSLSPIDFLCVEICNTFEKFLLVIVRQTNSRKIT